MGRRIAVAVLLAWCLGGCTAREEPPVATGSVSSEPQPTSPATIQPTVASTHATPSPTTLPVELPFAVVAPAEGSTIPTLSVVVSGTGPVGARIVRDISLGPDDEATVDATGTWAMAVILNEGSNTLKFRVGDDKATTIELVVTYAKPVPSDLGASIPGLTAADLKINLEDQGLQCDGPLDAGDGVMGYVCSNSSPSYYFEVSWFGLSPSDVRTIEGGVVWSGFGSGDPVFDDLLGYLATVPYEGATPTEARAWVRTTESGSKTFGPAAFALTTSENGRYRQLTIEAK